MFDIDKEWLEFEKEGRKAKPYNEGVFEWNHFQAKTNPAYLLILLKSVVQDIILNEDDQKTSFSFTINSDKGYSATIVEKTEPVVEGAIPPMIAQVEIF